MRTLYILANSGCGLSGDLGPSGCSFEGIDSSPELIKALKTLIYRQESMIPLILTERERQDEV